MRVVLTLCLKSSLSFSNACTVGGFFLRVAVPQNTQPLTKQMEMAPAGISYETIFCYVQAYSLQPQLCH